MSFTALHRVLGHAPGPLTEEMIDEAIAQGVAETDDLDWKSALPPTKGLNETDFPKDVAAMANSGGGVIVYGISEDEKKATGRIDCGELTEIHERTLRAAAINAIVPPLFGLDVIRLGEAGNRCVVIVIPPTVDGPHLVYKNEFFGAPIRNDADTVWMKERQIEAMYRARFDERRNTLDAIEHLYAELLAGCDTEGRAWLLAVGRPRVAPTLMTRWDRDEARDFFKKAIDHSLDYARRLGIRPLEIVDEMNPRSGLRRWIALGRNGTDSWREARASIHFDGSVTIAFAIGGHRSGPDSYRPGSQFPPSAVEGAVADFMGLVRAVGSQIGSVDFEVRLGIEFTGAGPLIMEYVDPHGYPSVELSEPMQRYSPVEATIEVGTDNDRFLHQVRELINDCVNQGGITRLEITSPCSCSECA